MKQSIGAHSIVYPAPVFVVGTYDAEGKPNVMTAAWGGDLLLSTTMRRYFFKRGNLHVYEYF